MGAPKVIHIKDVDKYDPILFNVVSIMRPAELSNKDVIGKDGTRKQVIEKFERKTAKNQVLMSVIADLDDAILVCCCCPKPCHGDAIVRLWRSCQPVKFGKRI